MCTDGDGREDTKKKIYVTYFTLQFYKGTCCDKGK